MEQIPEFWIQAIPLLMIATIFYCIVIRPNRAAEHRRYLSVMDLKGGERVVTTAGMFGTVVTPGEFELVVEFADGLRVTVMQEGIKKVLQSVVTPIVVAESAVVESDPTSP